MMRFQAVLVLAGKTATGIQVPDEVVAALGSGKRPAVVVTINEHTYRSTVAPMGGAFWIPVAGEHREAAGIAAGERVAVDLELDTAPREVEMPPDLAAALAAAPDAKRVFDGLSYSKKRWHVLAIEGAKTPETRQRRVTKAITTLRDG